MKGFAYNKWQDDMQVKNRFVLPAIAETKNRRY